MFRDSVRRCLSLLPLKLRLRWALLVALSTLSAGAELLGAAAIFSTIAMLERPATISRRWTDLVAAVAAHSPVHVQTMTAALAIVALILLAKNALIAVMLVLRGGVMADSMDAAFQRIAARILSVPYAVHLRVHSSELLTQATLAVDVAYRIVLASAVSVIAETLVVLAVTVVIVAVAPLGATIAIAMLAVLLAALAMTTRTATLGWGRDAFESQRSLLADLQSIAGGIEEIKVFGSEPYFLDRARATHRRFTRSLRQHVIALPMPRVIIETTFVILALGIAAAMSGSSGTALLPLFALFAYAGFRMIPAMNRIAYHIDEMRHGRRAVEQLTEGIMAEPAAPSAVPASLQPPFAGAIEANALTYRHPNATTDSLRGISFIIRRGESIGLVGATGAGKTTLLRLLAGILEPGGGLLAIAGVPLRLGRAGAPLRIGYVPQSIFLLDDTLRRNIAFGIPDEESDYRRGARAVSLAQLDDLVAALPGGLENAIGERGGRLSGGERQRLAMARALYHDPEILLLDEPTTALDAATEARLTAALEAVRGSKTLVIAAHHPSAIRWCDRFMILEEGRLRWSERVPIRAAGI